MENKSDGRGWGGHQGQPGPPVAKEGRVGWLKYLPYYISLFSNVMMV